MGVARSRTLLGEWEKNPANPILGANSAWQCPGHGDIVGTADGREFLLYHAYRKRSDAFSIGRETLLDEVKFENGWTTVNNGHGPSDGLRSPFQKISQAQPWNPNDEFSENFLLPQWNYPIFSDEKPTLNGGFLSLSGDSKESAEAVITERTVSGNYTASTRIAAVSPEPNESAGLSIYGGWRGDSVGINVGNGRISSWRRDDNKQQDLARVSVPTPMDTVLLRIKADDGEVFRLAYSIDEGRSWHDLGEKIAKTDIEGARLALVYNGGRSTPGYKFDWFHVKPD